jgi:nucleoredoxin
LFCAALLPHSATAAIETWTSPEGVRIQAEFLGIKGNYVTFRKADGSRMLFPAAKLTADDRLRIDVLTGALPADFAPTPAIATERSQKARPNKIAHALYGKLVGVRDGVVDSLALDHLADTRVYAIYYSASWCGPCRAFTPQLVANYDEIKTIHPEFEVIFVSADRDEKSMQRYMIDAAMPWAALRYKDVRSDSTLAAYRESGIPNLVFINAHGEVLSKSFDEEGNYLGPRKVLSDIRAYFRMQPRMSDRGLGAPPSGVQPLFADATPAEKVHKLFR